MKKKLPVAKIVDMWKDRLKSQGSFMQYLTLIGLKKMEKF